MATKMRWFDWLAYSILSIGAINWGIYGISRLFNKSFDLVTWLGQHSWMPLSNIIFTIVGIAGIYSIWTGIKLALD